MVHSANWIVPCSAVLSLAAEASAITALDWVLSTVLPALVSTAGVLVLVAVTWVAAAVPPVAVWVAWFVWLAT